MMLNVNIIRFIIVMLFYFMLTPVFSSPFNLTSQFNVSDTSNGVAWADLNNDECLDAVITEDDNGLLYLQN